MIVNIVVFFAVAMSLIFLISWGLSKDMRERIEQPKFDFLSRLHRAESMPSAGADGDNNEI